MIKAADNKPAAIYLRRSTERQEQSIGDQRTELRRYADEYGFKILSEYLDDAISGTDAVGRPGFTRMIEDAQRPDRPFCHVLVYDVKRLSRGDLDEAGYYRHLLRQRGVQVHYVTEGFTGQATDDIHRALKQYLAREESRDLSKVTIRGQLSSVKAGWWSGGVPPYGYDLEYVDPAGQTLHTVRFMESGEKAVFNLDGRQVRTLSRGQRLPKGDADKTRLVLSSPDRVNLVREIFDMYVNQSMGFKSIASRLNERGIPSPKNGRWSRGTHAGWSQSTVRSIIMNPVYTGDTVWNRRTSGKFHRIAGERAVERKNNDSRSLVWNDENDVVVVPGTHPAIIDHKLWESAQQIRLSREKPPAGGHFRSGRAKNSAYLLSGLIRCTNCGHAFIGQSIQKGKRRADGSRVRSRYYLCAGYLSKGTHICRKAPLPAEMLENDIWAIIGRQVDGFMQGGGEILVRKALLKAAKQIVEENTPDEESIVARIKEIAVDIKRLLKSITPVNAKYIDEEITALESEKNDLEQLLDRIRNAQVTAHDIDKIVDSIACCLRDFDGISEEGTPEERKEFVRVFVEGIELDARKGKAVARIKKFPAPKDLDAGKLSFGLVAGAGLEPATFGLCLPLQLSLP
jgi:DNA invertase Pin-like site-specific DNA recombinase